MSYFETKFHINPLKVDSSDEYVMKCLW